MARWIGYHNRTIAIRFSAIEAVETLDALDGWLEGYKEVDDDADPGEVALLFQSFSSIKDIRDRLWKEVNRT